MKLLLLVVFLLEVFGSIALKRWSAGAPRWWLATGISFYSASTLVWAMMLRDIGLGRAVMLYGVGSAVLYLVIGCAFYGETLTAQQWAGCGLGIVSLMLVL